MPTFSWLSHPDKHVLVNQVLRVGCAVWLAGRSFDAPPPGEFLLESVWSPSLAPFRRRFAKPLSQRVGPPVPCVGGALDRTSVSAVLLRPEWGRRRFVFGDGTGAISEQLRLTRRVAPSTVSLSPPSVGELLDLSQAVKVETKVAAAVDPSVTLSLVTGRGLGTAWADLVAADSGMEDSGPTEWLLKALLDDRQRELVLEFLVHLAGSIEGVPDDDLATTDEVVRRVLEQRPPFDDHDTGSPEQLAAGRNYAGLLRDWGVEALDALATRYGELVSRPGSVGFAGDPHDGELEVTLDLDDGAAADVGFTLVEIDTTGTDFAVKASTTLDGTEVSEYSDIVTVAEREGDLVWWEDPAHVTVIGRLGIPAGASW